MLANYYYFMMFVEQQAELEAPIQPELPSMAEDTSRVEHDSTLHAPVDTSNVTLPQESLPRPSLQPPPVAEQSYQQPPPEPELPTVSFDQSIQPEIEPEMPPAPPPIEEEQPPSPDIEDAEDLFDMDLPDAPPSVEAQVRTFVKIVVLFSCLCVKAVSLKLYGVVIVLTHQ